LQPRESPGTTDRPVTNDRTVARSPIAWTRQVTVTSIICGVDVSAAWLDACVRPAGAFARFANTAEGIEALSEFCRQHGVELVVMEATGGYERLAIGMLAAQGLGTAVVNPRAVRRFAEAMGLLEKTDRIDAAVIAWYAAAKGIVATPPAGEAQRKLAALVARLRQLTQLRSMQTNQRRLVEDGDAKASIDELLALLGRQMRELEGKIAARIADDPLWKALDAAFRSIKGVADRTVARLLAEMPEIGTISNKAAAKLAGLAPIARDSGQRSGKRPVRGGRRGIRSILFVVADVVRRHVPDFMAFHRKLGELGKAKKTIRIALARKLLVRLNAKARDVRRQLAAA
jgi:transposase